MRSPRTVGLTLGAGALLGWFGACSGSADNRREEDVFISALQADIRLIVGDTEVDVIATQSTAKSMRRRYRIAYEAGRWVCLGQVMKISPA